MMPLTVNADFLSAALAGYKQRLQEIDARMADLRRRIGGSAPAAAAPTPGPVAKKRRLSPEGRARIIAATRKRWAAVRKAKAEAARKPAAKKASPPRRRGRACPARRGEEQARRRRLRNALGGPAGRPARRLAMDRRWGPPHIPSPILLCSESAESHGRFAVPGRAPD